MCQAGPEAGTVIITVNYRLGVFGFYTAEALRREGGTAGNMGIQDQRLALQWVQANAAAFGGDPARVTIFGESAGASSAITHLTAPRSAGLFAAAAVESGYLTVRHGRDWATETAKSAALAAEAGCAAAGEQLACMRRQKAHTILNAQLKQGWTLAGPVADGYEYPLHATQQQILTSGNFTARPVLLGTNRNETALFLGNCSANANMTPAGMRARLLHADALPLATPSQLDQLLQLYDADTHYGGSWYTAFVDVLTDAQFYCGTRLVADAVAKQGAGVFAYRLDRAPYWFQALPCFGVPHMSDIFFLWGMFDADLEPTERALGKRMRDHWTAFAANHAPLAGWPAFGGVDKRRFLSFDAHVLADRDADSVGSQWKNAQCNLLDTITAKM
jgi:para-nitrobenzyl esterase